MGGDGTRGKDAPAASAAISTKQVEEGEGHDQPAASDPAEDKHGALNE